MPHHHILFVDDDEEDRYLLQTGFKEAGYTGHLKFVASIEAALKHLRQLSPPFYPSLIVLDFNNTGPNGSELLSHIHKLEGDKAVPVVFYSAGMRPLVRELLLACGVTACLEKPATPKEIPSVVQALLNLSGADRLNSNSL
jgi:CheY-like chemotaxis protein